MTGQLFIAVAALVAVLGIFALVVVDHVRAESPSEELPFVGSHRAGRWSR